tara:strand:- start:613 stop:858 length:246 start_codon:yes stop_codon:yes gene_type:complete
MNKIVITIALLLMLSCNKNEKVNREFYFSPSAKEDTQNLMTPSGDYVDLQIKIHSAYALLKALNSGAISQEEYEKLKKELI